MRTLFVAIERQLACFFVLHCVLAIPLNLNDPQSISNAASTIAYGMVSFYDGNATGGTPGLLPPPYSFNEAGLMWTSLIDYWYYTGDTTYNNITTEALLAQASSAGDFMPPSQTNETNSGQIYWGFAAMTAAEYKFPNPPESQPQWIELAAAVWNSQRRRWDTNACGGGLYEQIIAGNSDSYTATTDDPKDAQTNAGFLNLGARLYAYTGNSTYANWATKTWYWLANENIVVLDKTGYNVYSGLSNVPMVAANCSRYINMAQYTNNYGRLLNAAAIMYNVTGDNMWKQRALLIWKRSANIFFNPSTHVMAEVGCEPENNCNIFGLIFKGEFARSLAASIKWMPQLEEKVMPYLRASALGAAGQCDGGSTGAFCGYHWDTKTWDGTEGAGQQISALEAIQANLISTASDPVTQKNGGISQPRPAPALDNNFADSTSSALSTGAKAGIAVAIAIAVIAILAGVVWFVSRGRKKQILSDKDKSAMYLDGKAELPDHRPKRAQQRVVELAGHDWYELIADERQELDQNERPAQLDDACVHELHGNWPGHEMKA